MCEKGYEGEKINRICGWMETDKKDLTDEMYEKAELHEKGTWQMIFGVSTPAYRRNGYAEKLIRYVINDARHRIEQALLNSVKNPLFTIMRSWLSERRNFGSVHGGARWHCDASDILKGAIFYWTNSIECL